MHKTLRPKYSEHQVQHTTQDTKSNLLRMTLRPTEMSAHPKMYDWEHQVQLNTKYTKAKTLSTNLG